MVKVRNAVAEWFHILNKGYAVLQSKRHQFISKG